MTLPRGGRHDAGRAAPGHFGHCHRRDYASVALALVMIYQATHHVNFAQGEMATFSLHRPHLDQHWPAVLDRLHRRGGNLVRHRRRDRAHPDAADGKRPGARLGRRVRRIVADHQQPVGLAVRLYDQAVPQPVRQRHAPVRRLRFQPRAGFDRGDAHRADRSLYVLPPHPARPRDARRGIQSGVGSVGRYPGRLDAGAGLGPGRGDRRHRGRGGPHRLPRPQHDGRHPALRVRRRLAGRHRQPARRRARWFRRRHHREPDGRVHRRHRTETERGADHHRLRSGGETIRPARPQSDEPGVADARTPALAALVLIVLVAAAFLFSDYHLFQLTMVVVYAIAILGMTMLTGFNGQISLGHGAFYAIGAYTTGVLMTAWDVPYWATLPAAAVVCAGFGFLIGLPALRMGGLYLALTTFALAVAVPQVLKYKSFEQWTGGVQGLVIDKPDPPFGLPLNPDQWLYLFTLAIGAAIFLLVWDLPAGALAAP